MQKVAVVGSGISGMAIAYLLSSKFDVTIYEKESRLGGHSRTLNINYQGKKISVDTGFIVFNKVNYPNLTGLFEHLGVKSEKSDMSFGFTLNQGAFEWGARNLNSIFGQRFNLVNPDFYKMIFSMIYFFKRAPRYIDAPGDPTLGEVLKELNVNSFFRDRFILPMGSAIWSCSPNAILEFPAKVFIQFFKNHGLLNLFRRPQWFTVCGGSQSYVTKISQNMKSEIRLSEKVIKIIKEGDKIALQSSRGEKTLYDHVVLASHSDESLQLLQDATETEKTVLSAFRYQPNTAYLHFDTTVMPKRKPCWSSWNYKTVGEGQSQKNSVTYWMNLLQNIDPAFPLFLTLDPVDSLDPQKILDTHLFTHPIFTKEAIAMQAQIPMIQGKRNIWFCGAYQRYGFHEDGLLSALSVAKSFGVDVPWHS